MHTTGPHESPHTFVPAPTGIENHAVKDKAGAESGGVRETGEEGPLDTDREEKQQERAPTLVGSKEEAVSIEEKGGAACAQSVSDVPKYLAASFASSRPASVYRLRTSSEYRSGTRARGRRIYLSTLRHIQGDASQPIYLMYVPPLSRCSSSRLRGWSSFWIKGLFMLSIVGTVLVCLPLLRLSFSALGTQGLAGVFFLQVTQLNLS